MANRFVRKPVGNFFVKKSLQVGLIIKVMTVAVLSAIISSASLLLVYWLKYHTIAIYIWNQNNNNLHKEHIINLILPTLVISSIVGILAAFGIGLYASRKYAVPVYKIEQWVTLLLSGKMTAVLKFREREEMKELAQKCNDLGTMLRDTMLDVKKSVKAMQDAGVKDPGLEAITASLGKLELTSEQIVVNEPAKTDTETQPAS
ncbi:MAG: hypothetical protein LBC70_00925 [Chitinispirillales bacterium]|jgi:methyl-accepting chemotaxis protein|nr:hypothetical protein [Chitinispirillales bacterium]